jgi:hypothetical protein
LKVQEIKEIARQKNLDVKNMKKTDIVRAIQQAEGNSDCYHTGHVEICGQSNCLWREDCR